MGIAVACQTFSSLADLPQYLYPGDAAVGLAARQSLVLDPGRRALVSTGLAMRIPHGYAGLVLPVPHLAIDYGVTVLGAPGLVSRGEVMVGLINHGSESFTVLPELCIAQLMIVPVERGRFYVGEI